VGVGVASSKPCMLMCPLGNTDTGQRDFKQEPKLCSLPHEVEAAHSEVSKVDSNDEDSEDIFYKFVIFHADSDINEAIRVQNLLQNTFCIKPGIIFAEMPCGRHLLENLNNAVNGSAWTIILLTENFLSEVWYKFQSYASLINALNKPHKYNSFIPMRPLNNPLPRGKMPFVLQTIKVLEEGSPAFAKQVGKIFQESKYRHQQAIWRKEMKETRAIGMVEEICKDR
uniref:TIR domain-containing adapter molecule 2 n=1 Tax=Sphenodon punctatus TaxID=8508 RepID=A0A8D0HN63_SPHPU